MTTVSFETNAFIRSHGKPPRGWGCWGFFIDGKLWFAPHSMPYAQAKKAAAIEVKKQAMAAGAWFVKGAVVYVQVAP